MNRDSATGTDNPPPFGKYTCRAGQRSILLVPKILFQRYLHAGELARPAV